MVGLLTQGVLLATMQGSLAVRVVMMGKDVRFFDIMQAASGLVIGSGGAVLVARGSPAGLGLIGAITALLASGAYLAAIHRLRDRPHLTASFHTFATFGLVAATTALVLMVSGTMLTLAASGALTAAAVAWTLVPTTWPALTLVGWLALGVTGLCATLQPARPGEIGDVVSRIGRLTIAATLVFVAGGAAVLLVGPPVAGTPPDAGILASLRTILVSLIVIGLGATARWTTPAVFSRLVYPVIVVGGLRLVADDFIHSRPATLFLALAFFGVALTLGPRWGGGEVSSILLPVPAVWPMRFRSLAGSGPCLP